MILKADGFDDAIKGVATRANGDRFLVYDRERCIKILMRDMTYEEAVEYFDYNVQGAWMGEGTPSFIEEWDEEEYANELDQE